MEPCFKNRGTNEAIKVILVVDVLISIGLRWIAVIVIDHKLIVESIHILPFLNLVMGSDFNVGS